MRNRITAAAIPLMLALSCCLVAKQEPGDRQELFTEHTSETFREFAPAQEKIDEIDHDLLAAAVFHATNARRAGHDLPALRFEPRVRSAAAMQADILQERDVLAHQNPERAGKETPTDRLKAAGLQPRFAAENLATAFLLDYKSGEQVIVDSVDGRTVFRREPGGPPLERRTYLAFAEELLDQWMASPTHRPNILAAEAEYLGTACRPEADPQAIPALICVQVFFAPL